jgi:hypothetical protein
VVPLAAGSKVVPSPAGSSRFQVGFKVVPAGSKVDAHWMSNPEGPTQLELRFLFRVVRLRVVSKSPADLGC